MTQRIGIIGGSGLGNALLARARGESVKVQTPFGDSSAEIILMDWAGVPIAFLARHGVGHTHNPSQVPYRANIFALKTVGCQWIIASGAVGQCVQKVGEAEVLVRGGIKDVLVSNEVVGERKLRRLAALAQDATIALC